MPLRRRLTYPVPSFHLALGIFFTFAQVVLADVQEFESIKLEDGRVLENVRVLSPSTDNVVLRHDDGIATFNWSELPENVRHQFGITELPAEPVGSTPLTQEERESLLEEGRLLMKPYLSLGMAENYSFHAVQDAAVEFARSSEFADQSAQKLGTATAELSLEYLELLRTLKREAGSHDREILIPELHEMVSEIIRGASHMYQESSIAALLGAVHLLETRTFPSESEAAEIRELIVKGDHREIEQRTGVSLRNRLETAGGSRRVLGQLSNEGLQLIEKVRWAELDRRGRGVAVEMQRNSGIAKSNKVVGELLQETFVTLHKGTVETLVQLLLEERDGNIFGLLLFDPGLSESRAIELTQMIDEMSLQEKRRLAFAITELRDVAMARGIYLFSPTLGDRVGFTR